MDDRVLKALAVLFLALAIGAVFGSVQATSRASAFQGPSALIVTSGGEVWLSVERELWRVSRDGSLRDTQAIEATGLPGAPASLVHAPDGSVVASVRGDATLYVLDAASARVVRRLAPQWPDDLRQHGARAINFAFAADGRVAIATGGGHAVALFDPEGRFLARTAPGAYEFTNGLWWSAEGLWTTDTNRFALRLLDPATLAQRRAVDLGRGVEGSYLGPARARPGSDGVAALLRYHNGMVDGGVARVGSNGRATALPHGDAMQPRDLDWRDDELLVTDGLSSSILRWSAQGRALAPFGDAALQARLHALAQERRELRAQHTRWLVAAVTLLLLGLIAAGAAAMAARRQQPVRALDLSRLGTPQVDRWTLMRLNLRANGALFALGLPVLALNALPLAPRPLPRAWTPWLLGAAALFLMLVVVGVWLHQRRLKRLARQPEFEPVFNQFALHKLRTHAKAVAAALGAHEQVLESFHLQPGRAWWILTDRRLLRFEATLTDLRLTQAHALSDVRATTTQRGRLGSRGWTPGADDTSWVEVALRSGPSISGSTSSPPLAQRVVTHIERLTGLLRAQPAPRGTAAPAEPGRSQGRRWRRALLSFVLPGAGHWLQRRAAEGTLLLALWLAVVFFLSGPMVWTLVEPYTAVSRAGALWAAAIHLSLGLLAAVDVWRLD